MKISTFICSISKYFLLLITISIFLPNTLEYSSLPPTPVAIYTDYAYITVTTESNAHSILITNQSPKLLIAVVEYVPQSCVSNCNPIKTRMICFYDGLQLKWISSFDAGNSGALAWDGTSNSYFYYAEGMPRSDTLVRVYQLSIADGSIIKQWTVSQMNKVNCIKIINSDLFGCGQFQGTFDRLGYFIINTGSASGTQSVAQQWGTTYCACIFCDDMGSNSVMVISRSVLPVSFRRLETFTNSLTFFAAIQGNPWTITTIKEMYFLYPSNINSQIRFALNPKDKTTLFLLFPLDQAVSGSWNINLVNPTAGTATGSQLYYANVAQVYAGTTLLYISILGIDNKPRIFYHDASTMNIVVVMPSSDLLGSSGGRPLAIHELSEGQILVLLYGSSLTIGRIEQKELRVCPTNSLDFLGKGCRAILTSGCFSGCSSCLSINDPNTCIATSDATNFSVLGFGLRCKNGVQYFKPGETTCSAVLTSGCPASYCPQECMSATTCAAYCDPINGPQYCRETRYFVYWTNETDYKASTLYAACQGNPDYINLRVCRDIYRPMCCWGNQKLSNALCGQALARSEEIPYCRFCPIGLTSSQCLQIASSCFPSTLGEPTISDYSLATTQSCLSSLITNTNIVAAYTNPIQKLFYNIFSCYDPIIVSSAYTGNGYFTLVFNEPLLPNLPFPSNGCDPIVKGADDYWSKGSPVCSQPDAYSIKVTTTSYIQDLPTKVTVTAKTYCSAPFTITATLTNIPVILTVSANLTNPNISRCNNVEINSTVFPAYKSLSVTYLWSAVYASLNNVPTSIILALQSYSNTTNRTLFLPSYTLAKGATIQISLTINDTSIAKNVSTSLSILTDSTGSNIYCGPCQFTNRSLCYQLNGVCWINYNNGSEVPNYSINCLWQMATICYSIWKINPSDPQCADFSSKLNFTLMSKIPTALNANHTTGDGNLITINFDTNISNSQLSDCAMILTAESLRAISPEYTCTWFNKSQLQIKYLPSGINFIKNLTLKSGVIAFDYLYSQEFAPETNLQVTPPVIATKVTLLVPSAASPCATLTISMLPSPALSDFWQFAWKITYSSGGYSTDEKQSAESYFAQFQALKESNRVISIPSTYLYPNSILNILANAKNALSTDIVVNEANINLSTNMPSVSFKSKQSLLEILRGSKKNSFPVEVAKSNCGQRRRLLQGNDNNNGSNLADVIIWFEVRSGANESNIQNRGDEEKQIEGKINAKFSSLQLVSLSIYDYFKYYVYYNLTVYARYKDSNVTASDYVIIMLTKKPLTCKIDTNGFLLNPKNNIILDSSLSDLEWGDGDSVSYYWKCEECKPLANSSPCDCNIFKSFSEQFAMKATVLANTLSNLAKYTISLSIKIVTGSNSRSCSTKAEIVTHDKARSGIKAVIKNGYEKQSSDGVKNIYFATEMTNSDLEDGYTGHEWTLVGVSSKDNDKMQYTNFYTYLADTLKKDFNTIIDSNLATNDNPIPSELIPKVVSSPNMFPPILGINQNDLKPNTKYNYALKIRYSNSSPVIATVAIETKPAIVPRSLKISPSSGIGYKTKFAFSFIASMGSTSDQASYQLFRLDCPNLSSQDEYKTISPKMSNANSFTSTLSPGLNKCSNQISIKLITTVDSSQIESLQTIVVEPDSGETQESQIEGMLSDLLSSNGVISYTDSMSMLITISQAGIAGKLTSNMVTGMMKLLSQYTDEKIAELFTALDPESQIDFVNICAGAIQSVTKDAPDKIDKSVANTSMAKINSLLMNVKTADGGSFVIPKVLGALAGLVGAPDKSFKSKDFYNKMMFALNTLTDMKLKELIPGGPPYSLSSPDIELVIQSNMTKNYNASQTCKTELNQTVILPKGIAPIFVNQSNGSTPINKLTISMALYATSFNPYEQIKNSTQIDIKSLTNNSIENGFVYPETIAKIYNDLKSSDKLNSVVDKTTTDSKVLQSSFFLAKYSAASGQEVFNQNISVGLLPNGSEVESLMDLSASAVNYKNATIIPVYYNAENTSWTNEGCYLSSSNSSKSLNSSLTATKCNTIGPSKKNISTRISMVMAIDLIQDVWKVIKAGNYQMLYNFSSLTDLSAENSIGLIIGFGIFFFVLIGSYFLYKKDEKALFLARYEALNQFFEKSELVECKEKGFLADLRIFFSEVKKKGFIGKAEDDKKVKDDEQQVTVHNLTKVKKNKNAKNSVSKHTNNGYHFLSRKDEKELKDIYGTLNFEAKPVYGEQKSLEMFYKDIMESKILARKTEIYLDNKKLSQQDTFWGLLITEHPWLLILFVLNMSTPRYIQLIITGMVFLGQLFTAGYFYDAKDKVNISDDVNGFIGKAVVVTIASALLMIPIKITASVFLTGKTPTENMTREQVGDIEKKNLFFKKIGLFLSFIWLFICAWGITMFSIQFETIAMHKWIFTYLFCFGNEFLVIEQLKIVFKVLIGVVLMRFAKSGFMLTLAGIIAAKIVDFIMKWV